MNQNYKADKISELKKDLSRLNKLREVVEAKLDEFDNDPKCDPTHVTKYINEKDQIAKLIDDKTKELRAEEYRQQTAQGDDEQKRVKDLFDKKNNSYSSIRSSYIK